MRVPGSLSRIADLEYAGSAASAAPILGFRGADCFEFGSSADTSIEVRSKPDLGTLPEARVKMPLNERGSARAPRVCLRSHRLKAKTGRSKCQEGLGSSSQYSSCPQKLFGDDHRRGSDTASFQLETLFAEQAASLRSSRMACNSAVAAAEPGRCRPLSRNSATIGQ